MNSLEITSGVITIPSYILLYRQIASGDVKHQNIASWILWVILDIVAMLSIIANHGNFLMLAFYTCGGTIIVSRIFRSGSFKWTHIETFTAFLVFLSIYLWYISGPRTATVVSTIAVFMAAIPQYIDTYKEPYDSPILAWVGFLVACIISTFAAKSWAWSRVEEWFYPFSCALLTLILILISCRKFYVLKPSVETATAALS